MRTTLDLPESLILEVQEILSTNTKTETIIEALKKVAQLHKRQQLIYFRGAIDLDINMDKLRGRHEDLG